MPPRSLALLFVIGIFTACIPNSAIQPASLTQVEPPTPLVVAASATPEIIASPTAAEPDPSYKVAAFYYPWYGNPETDGEWIHWTQNNHVPPEDISSDFYPALGAYSSNDPAVIAQHMEWLRQAGIGVIISSWWGQGSREDRAVPLLLQRAEQYGIKVAFHIEPYNGRTAESLVSDIQYLYKEYGGSPAFFRSTAASRYSLGAEPKGMFFVWSIGSKGSEGERVGADYWRNAMDAIHSIPEGALIIANTTNGSWVNHGHFDGLYNYATLHTDERNVFDWARSLPPDSLYVPSVIPGFSAKRVGYADTTYVPRENGSTYEMQWGQALGTGVEPAMVTITSFNEWHEGTIIEPPQFGVDDGAGYTYADFDTYSPEGYLHHTRDWIDRYLARTWPTAYRMRIQVITTSDWTTLDILDNGARIKPVWIRPERVSASDSATAAELEAGDRLLLTQSLEDAQVGKEVEMTWDVMVTPVPDSTYYDLILQIDRGDIGKTQVTVFNYLGETPIEVQTFEWDQVTSERNSHQIAIPLELLTTPNP
jgi:glycoprotein endo-alpha-1,2-mannosidase